MPVVLAALMLCCAGGLDPPASMDWHGRAGVLPSVAQLECEGVPLVVAADAAGQLLPDHRFVYAAALDLRVTDVEALLVQYKVELSHMLAAVLPCPWP